MPPAIRVENLGKRYRLGQTHATSLRDLVNSAASRLFGRRNGHPLAPAAPQAEAARLDEEGYFWAIKEVSFEVQPGEVVGIIGRNGAGKSTLLKILSNIVSPTTGHVELHGRVASLLEVGTGFHPELTGRENVFLNGAILGMTKTEVCRKFDEIVAFAEIEQFIDTPVKRYSSGMYVRLAFAVAAHLESEILIIDEVLAVGDVEFQQRCLGKMNSVAHSGRTVLFVSHNLASVRQLTRHCILLSKGEVAFHGKTDEALAHYLRRSAPSDQGVVYDVSQIERPFGDLNQELQLRRLTLLSEHRDGFLNNGRLSFQVILKARTDVSEFRFAMTIFRDDQLPVGSCFSKRLGGAVAGTEFAVNLTLNQLPLASGNFYCAISVGDTRSQQEWTLFDSVTEVLRFSVTPGKTGEGFQSWLPGWGPVRFSDIAVSEPVNVEFNDDPDAWSKPVGKELFVPTTELTHDVR